MSVKSITEVFDKKIITFLSDRHLMAVSTVNNGIPYIFHCFYSYMEEEKMLVFTSSEETLHVQNVQKNNIVSAGIGLETKDVTKIQGAQIVGEMYQPSGKLGEQAYKNYTKKFPFAKLMKTNIWVLDIKFFKMTDNRFGFGKKLIYGELPK